MVWGVIYSHTNSVCTDAECELIGLINVLNDTSSRVCFSKAALLHCKETNILLV